MSEDFLSGGRQMTGCAGYPPGRGAKLIKDMGERAVSPGSVVVATLPCGS